MKVEETIALKDSLALATKRAETAETAAKDLIAKLEAAGQARAELASKISALEAAAAESAKTLAARDQETAALKKELETTRASVDERAGLKAAEQLAKLGVKPAKEAAPETAANAADLWQQYAQISDPIAKREFYLAHKEQM